MSRRFKTQVYCHKLVMETAKEMAGAFYEEFALDDTWYKAFPDQKEFIEKQWGRFLAAARSTLAKMLSMPIDDGQKELIQEALLADNALNTHRLRNTRLL
jgi:hypothetical protein